MARQKQQLRQKQKVCLTLRFQQMMWLLQLSSADLLKELKSVIEDCIFLDLDDDEKNMGIYGAWQYQDSGFDFYGVDHLAKQETLREKLLWQLDITPLTPLENAIAQVLVDGIDDRGYLTVMPDEVISILPDASLSLENVLFVLKKIQDFDPPGVAARTLQESLSLQIERGGYVGPVKKNALYLIEAFSEIIANQDLKAISRKSGLSVSEIKEAIAIIRRQNPCPGLSVCNDNIEYNIPDIIIFNENDRWQVKLNKKVSPVVRVNSFYMDNINDFAHQQEERVSSWKKEIAQAHDFVRNLKNRYDTLLKVARVIAFRQQKYLKWGDEYMCALSMREVAKVLELHESTVSRAVRNKFVQTPSGVVPMNYFFSSDVGGQGTSSVALRARIQKIVRASECESTPVTDIHIKRTLEMSGINVSRRTVTKYRQSLGFAPSRYRCGLYKL